MGDTRAVLRGRARVLADQDSADFPTDDQYNDWLNTAKKDVWHDLVTAGWPVNYATATVTATGAEKYQLASGAALFSVTDVRYVQGGVRTPVQRLDESNRAALLSQPLTGQFAQYEVVLDPTSGTCIRFTPRVSGTFEVDYIAETPAFSNDADTWYGPSGSADLICLLAAAKGCRKEGRRGDAADLLQDYQETLAKVIARAGWVDQRGTARIRDVQASLRRDAFDYQVEGID